MEWLEPDARKQARPVLRGRDGGNVVLLPDYVNDYDTLEEARASIGRFLEAVDNAKRLPSALGYCPPAEYEATIIQLTPP